MGDFSHSEQAYKKNTAILVTTLYDTNGNSLQITDFAPLFPQFSRGFHPYSVLRIVEPLEGMPKIAVRCRPASDYGRQAARCKHGSNHMRFYFGESSLRLTSNIPMAYLWGEVPFVLEDPIYMILGPDESLTRSIADVAR